MRYITGIFDDTDALGRAVGRLRERIPDERINTLTPADGHDSLESIDTVDDMPPVGGSMGATLGGALGATMGLLIPGVGAVTAAGALWAALLGTTGGALGWRIGRRIDDLSDDGLPVDELHIYEEVLRAGRSVVVVEVAEEEIPFVKATLEHVGAEEIDAARRQWWSGLRAAEKADFEAGGGTRSFEDAEEAYLHGFSTALSVANRGEAIEQVTARLRKRGHPHVDDPAFALGFARARSHMIAAAPAAD